MRCVVRVLIHYVVVPCVWVRYVNIIPYDHSRVVLPFGDDYINANWIPGYVSDKDYVAAQGPTPHTVVAFWRMILHTKAEVVVMVTGLVEKGKTKCEKYWPEKKTGATGATEA